MQRIWSLFTKPWPDLSCEELGALASGLGFNAIEFPVRPGFQVTPETALQELPKLVKSLSEKGVAISSVACAPTEAIFAACREADVPLIRIMIKGDPSLGFWDNLEAAKKHLDGLLPLCEKYGVKVGVQPHYGFTINTTMELRTLLESFAPCHIGGIWDAAHSALAGETPAQALDIIGDRLLMVNLKNAYYKNVGTNADGSFQYKPYFTTGRQGASPWRTVAEELNKRGFDGPICMTAEYTDESRSDEFIREDAAYAKSLFG